MTPIGEALTGTVILVGVAVIAGYDWEWWQVGATFCIGLFVRIIAP